MLSYNVVSATRQALRQRADWMEQGQTLLLAVRITPTTVDPLRGQHAVRCPACWDESLRQTTVPDDPVCLGVGWVIPPPGGPPVAQPVLAGMGQSQIVPQGLQAGEPAQEIPLSGQQGGYLTAVPLVNAFINDQEQVTQWTPQGIAQYNADRLYWSPGPLAVKKFDVIIRTGSTLAHDRRYVVGDQLEPKTLGSAVLFETAALELRHEDNIVYSIPVPDAAGLEAGSWT